MPLGTGSDQDISAWDAVASTYAGVAGTADSISSRFARFVSEAVGDPNGLDILDVGCGHGWLAGRLSGLGANVKGVDGSGELLSIARARHPGIEFYQADLTTGLPPELGQWRFDRAIALMVLMDLPELDQLLADIARGLQTGGRLVVTMTHPAFFSHKPVTDEASGERYRRVTGYLAPEQRWVKSFGGHRHYHRPLGWYVDCLAGHGFAVTKLFEPATPPPDGRPESEWGEYDRWLATIPTMLGLVAEPHPQRTARKRRGACRPEKVP